MPGVPVTCGDDTRVLPTHCTRGCGCTGHPAFPTPSMGRRIHAQPGHNAPRERGVMSEAGCLAIARQLDGNEFCLRSANHKSVVPRTGFSTSESVMLRFKLGFGILASVVPLLIAAVLARG